MLLPLPLLPLLLLLGAAPVRGEGSASACARPGVAAAAWGSRRAPPGPPPAPGAPRLLRLPLAFRWPGSVSLVVESWRLEETPGGPPLRLLGRAVSRPRLRPGGPWRGGAGGGLRFGTRLRCPSPPRAPRCPPCAPCAPRRCWSRCCAPRGCRGPCAPPSACAAAGLCS
ncbi:delta-like protein 3, partial [Hirundo rustica]|uniref:delta-like protein 3 n=1 Tax=Hirundo rustica TaxID=43150 RepID=UPI002673B6C8